MIKAIEAAVAALNESGKPDVAQALLDAWNRPLPLNPITTVEEALTLADDPDDYGHTQVADAIRFLAKKVREEQKAEGERMVMLIEIRDMLKATKEKIAPMLVQPGLEG